MQGLDCGQLLLVKQTSGAEGQLVCCEKGADGLWTQVLTASVYIGKNGVSDHHVEGDMASPLGLYPLGTAFSTEETVPFAYPCRTIGPRSWWVDDAESPLYNQWVEADGKDGFTSGEKMDQMPVHYHYGLVVEYNTDPITPGRGSAIFIHCKGDLPYTHGCVAMEEAVMLKVLGWLDAKQHPQVLIH